MLRSPLSPLHPPSPSPATTTRTATDANNNNNSGSDNSGRTLPDSAPRVPIRLLSLSTNGWSSTTESLADHGGPMMKMTGNPQQQQQQQRQRCDPMPSKMYDHHDREEEEEEVEVGVVVGERYHHDDKHFAPQPLVLPPPTTATITRHSKRKSTPANLEIRSIPGLVEPGGGLAGRKDGLVPPTTNGVINKNSDRDKPPAVAHRAVTQGTAYVPSGLAAAPSAGGSNGRLKMDPPPSGGSGHVQVDSPNDKKNREPGVTIYLPERSFAISEVTTPSDLRSFQNEAEKNMNGTHPSIRGHPLDPVQPIPNPSHTNAREPVRNPSCATVGMGSLEPVEESRQVSTWQAESGAPTKKPPPPAAADPPESKATTTATKEDTRMNRENAKQTIAKSMSPPNDHEACPESPQPRMSNHQQQQQQQHQQQPNHVAATRTNSVPIRRHEKASAGDPPPSPEGNNHHNHMPLHRNSHGKSIQNSPDPPGENSPIRNKSGLLGLNLPFPHNPKVNPDRVQQPPQPQQQPPPRPRTPLQPDQVNGMHDPDPIHMVTNHTSQHPNHEMNGNSNSQLPIPSDHNMGGAYGQNGVKERRHKSYFEVELHHPQEVSMLTMPTQAGPPEAKLPASSSPSSSPRQHHHSRYDYSSRSSRDRPLWVRDVETGRVRTSPRTKKKHSTKKHLEQQTPDLENGQNGNTNGTSNNQYNNHVDRATSESENAEGTKPASKNSRETGTSHKKPSKDPKRKRDEHVGDEEQGERPDLRGVRLVTREEKQRYEAEERIRNARYWRVSIAICLVLTLGLIIVAVIMTT